MTSNEQDVQETSGRTYFRIMCFTIRGWLSITRCPEIDYAFGTSYSQYYKQWSGFFVHLPMHAPPKTDTLPHPLRHPAHQVVQRLGACVTQAFCRLLTSAFLEVAGSSMSCSSCTMAQRFSIGDRSGLLPGHTPFSQNDGRLSWHHSWVLVAL